MQFVRRGPDIPERLLQLHEDGRVAFFCGAGISYPAGLPGFRDLVTKLYAALHVTPDPVQAAAIKAWQFDTAIGLLEGDVMGGRETVRKAMGKILQPDLSAPNATATHEALLTLSKNRSGQTRLITTNFDRLFEYIVERQPLLLPRYQAPLLPVPKTRWDGLIYLHGLLSAVPTAAELDCLVISSGDFGLAYLTERWAARFVSELFRGYTVCFVGYSINDPVLRYMMDALAADRLLGESPPEMFAFGSFSTSKKQEHVANEWKAKNVTPILYRERRNYDHGYLHDTLRAWAGTYRDGVRGKERIVSDCAISRPLASTKQDNFVGRMLWALSDNGGLPAQRFADFDPVPDLDWLKPLSETLYRHADLGRFGVPALVGIDKKLEFSMTHRPAPYTKSSWMGLAHGGGGTSNWDAPMHNIARWLVRHLDDPRLPLWLVKRGGRLHHQFSWLIGQRLDDLAKLERDGDEKELARIRKNSPRAIPRASMRVLWRLLLNKRVRAWARRLDLFSWHSQLERDGLTATVRLALREALSPCVVLQEPFRWPAEMAEDESDRLSSVVNWKLELTSEHVHSAFEILRNNPAWTAALPDLLLDFDVLLHDALDLMQELGGADDRSDRSYVDQPSISKHPQNRSFHDWTALIELARDAWVETSKVNPNRARTVAESWASAIHPVFRRLSFFSASHLEVIPANVGLQFLLKDSSWWLWSVETQRETMRLLVALGPVLDKNGLDHLERAIVQGPPREMFKKHIEDEQWMRLVDRNVWLRLQKLATAGTALSDPTRLLLRELTDSNPVWKLDGDEREEFPFWMDSGWSGDRDPWRAFKAIPRKRRGVLEYLTAHPTLGPNEQDDWRQRCSDSFQATSYALFKLAETRDIWPADRWRDALQAWADEKLRLTSWHYMAPLLARAPDALLQATANGTSWWLQGVAKQFEEHEADFLNLARRIIHLPFEIDSVLDDPVFRAINHPIGQVTTALLDWWYRQDLEDNQKLPNSLLSTFTELCDTSNAIYLHGRVLLATHAITIYRVDPTWANEFLLPLFDWDRSSREARGAWEGYLWSPRLYRPMMDFLKPTFLATAKHYDSLGDHRSQYVSLLALAALDPGDTFKAQELASAVRSLPANGLADLADSLVKAVEGAGDQREEYWRNRVIPLWEKVWPKARENAQNLDGAALARLCIAAGNEFPSAVTMLQNWLSPIQYPDYVIRRLHEENLCRTFPEHALLLLHLIISGDAAWLPPEFRECLSAISQGGRQLAQDQRYMRLDQLARQAGL